ncbi:hypothetical protein BS78_05G172400 [Paspalum vaginatum]|nr:hypothetical protein BS78_05G172400 [Paspalum vaginatum]
MARRYPSLSPPSDTQTNGRRSAPLHGRRGSWEEGAAKRTSSWPAALGGQSGGGAEAERMRHRRAGSTRVGGGHRVKGRRRRSGGGLEVRRRGRRQGGRAAAPRAERRRSSPQIQQRPARRSRGRRTRGGGEAAQIRRCLGGTAWHGTEAVKEKEEEAGVGRKRRQWERCWRRGGRWEGRGGGGRG